MSLLNSLVSLGAAAGVTVIQKAKIVLGSSVVVSKSPTPNQQPLGTPPASDADIPKEIKDYPEGISLYRSIQNNLRQNKFPEDNWFGRLAEIVSPNNPEKGWQILGTFCPKSDERWHHFLASAKSRKDDSSGIAHWH
jgi:hypothetical protein